MDEKKKIDKEALKQLRQARQASVKHAKDTIKTQNRDIKQIKEQLKDGGKTVPQIAAAIKMPPSKVLIYVTALRSYGMVAEGAKEEDYFKYELAS
jgi:translation elongation factor EF-Ts